MGSAGEVSGVFQFFESLRKLTLLGHRFA